ncbi:hypothetical protein [Trichormus variabilis]|uniref:Uncharacterized protein n=1 Tax=Trichormus variabilis SAG 1403-4b TaxID=447716 RepID=A0A3S1A777_ANAVA|nr:hypothetical protein [Trichormus variabilis]MBD2628676.1 hypothetical protein [Trichormus variabilis FACHB-164]RUS94732.1 hypothetical protein DSM107003_34090 [Trichormus variabilis SAG 1403-4b]
MNVKPQTEKDKPEGNIQINQETEKVLCVHCQRTATNGKCKGICVADNDY